MFFFPYWHYINTGQEGTFTSWYLYQGDYSPWGRNELDTTEHAKQKKKKKEQKLMNMYYAMNWLCRNTLNIRSIV